ncbi:DUF2515 family protein [Cohnella pontilimi]|nr:DUF2515 family protein [Cohnella pontilimi]
MAYLLKKLAEGVWRKATVYWRSAVMSGSPRQLTWHREVVQELAAAWKEQKERKCDGPFSFTHARERIICEHIRKETTVWNRNNVTRTQAYWNVYREFPELHWALLAHLVSRNGGWCMTDLQGQWLPKLLGGDLREKHFQLLECCNALIFRDAYPQLKLYAESRRTGKSLLHLLPYFEVSAFMLPLWQRFWKHTESALLTVALIINEQNVIQGPIIEGSCSDVLESLSFRSQPLLQTNQIVFPLLPPSREPGHAPLRLAGRIIERFENLHERIAFGKELYAILFGYPKILSGAESFAGLVAHTGSRADYWPQRFDPRRIKTGGTPRKRRHSAGELWYSPPLEAAWPDQPLPETAPPDWFTAPDAVLPYLNEPRPPKILDMTFEHLHGQRKLQVAAEAANLTRSP